MSDRSTVEPDPMRELETRPSTDRTPPAAVRAATVTVAAILVAIGMSAALEAPTRGHWGDGEHAARPLRIDLNRAEATEIALLPGIGPTMAARIVDDRDRHGPFSSTADLERVRGIGPRTVERIAPLVQLVGGRAAIQE